MGKQQLEAYLSILAIELSMQARDQDLELRTFQAPGALWLAFIDERTGFSGTATVNKLVPETGKQPDTAAAEFIEFLKHQSEFYGDFA